MNYLSKAKQCIYLTPFFTCLWLSGCMDLAATQRTPQVMNTQSRIKGQVYTMRGIGGIFSQGMNRLEDKFVEIYKIPTASTIWYKAKNLSKYIIQHHENKTLQGPIILIGHSLGANEQITVAKYLNNAHIAVDLLITVDAVSPSKVPPNVKEVLNIYKPGFVPMFSGIKITAINPNKTHVENFDVRSLKNVYLNHFTIDKKAETQQIMLQRVLAVINKANNKHMY